MMPESFLNGSVYTVAVGSAMQSVDCITSVLQISRRHDDAPPSISTATKGFEARQLAVSKFLESDHDFILLLDHDQTFPVDTLERLRAHGRQFVSGLYMQRHVDPVLPVWRKPFDNFPARLWLDDIEPGRLYELGSAGWGCVLIHRSVFEQMAPILKGEPFIIEDDMDVWPYDLPSVLSGEERVRPLRGDKSNVVGSDIRFGFFARKAGVKLWGDSSVECGHAYTHMLSLNDYKRQDIEKYRALNAIQQARLEEEARATLARLDQTARLGAYRHDAEVLGA